MSTADTIAAISTPPGVGGIGTVRVSGPAAREICDRVFASPKGRRIADAPGYTALYGRVSGPDGPIDEAIALVFAAPASYTGEDVVELSVHGGGYIVKALLRALLAAGARGGRVYPPRLFERQARPRRGGECDAADFRQGGGGTSRRAADEKRRPLARD